MVSTSGSQDWLTWKPTNIIYYLNWVKKMLWSSLKMQKNFVIKLTSFQPEGFSSQLNSAEVTEDAWGCDLLHTEHPHSHGPDASPSTYLKETAYENLESRVDVGYEESSYSLSYLLVNWTKVTRSMCINSSRSA